MERIGKRLRAFNMASSSKPLSLRESLQNAAKAYNQLPGDRHLQDGYECPLCSNKGIYYVVREDDNGHPYVTGTECSCYPIRHTLLQMKRSGLKDVLKEKTFEKFEAGDKWQAAIKEAAERYAKDPKGWFFIGGQSGCGKTHLCTAICGKFLLEGKRVSYMLWRDEIVKIKAAVTDSVEYAKQIDTFKKAEVLYIDDLFKAGKADGYSMQRPTAADINVAFEILNYRYNDPESITIVSSELTAAELIDIDEATGGRLFERAQPISIGKDRKKNYRLRGALEL
jgi:DNA replication protein DnaC